MNYRDGVFVNITCVKIIWIFRLSVTDGATVQTGSLMFSYGTLPSGNLHPSHTLGGPPNVHTGNLVCILTRLIKRSGLLPVMSYVTLPNKYKN